MAIANTNSTSTKEKEWRIGEALPVSANAWTCDIIRVEDGQVVKKLLLTPETLPPRFKGKKIVWQLPTKSGSIPNFGLFEQERIMVLFKESRKKSKKEKKPPKDNSVPSALPTPIPTPVPVPTPASTPIPSPTSIPTPPPPKVAKYTIEELLQLRSNATTPPTTLPPCIQSNSTPSTPSKNLPPPGLIPSTIPVSPGRCPLVIAPPAARPLDKIEEELLWKSNWKLLYLNRLEALAETAWQNHLTQQRNSEV